MATYTQKQFNQHHKNNPKIYKMFVEYALYAARRRPYFSARAIFQRMRWETMIEENTKKTFKISNNWIAFYSRKFMEDYPEHKGFFRTCVQKGSPHNGGEQ